jgi:thiol-disulfide isomerase/thioredoxin
MVSMGKQPLWMGFLSLLLIGSAGGLYAGDAREAFAELEAELQSATDAFFTALAEAEPQAGGEGKSAPPSRPVVDRRPEILKKMDALAAATKDEADARFVALNTFFWSVSVQPESLLDRFEKFTKKYPDESELAEIIIALPDVYRKSGTLEQWSRVLREFARTTKSPELKSITTFVVGRLFMSNGKLSDARSAFEDVARNAGEDRELEQAARAFLFEIEHLQIGMKAPDFKARSLSGREVSLRDVRGKVVLLNFWASWCVPCIIEIPHLQKLAETFRDQPFDIFAFSLDDNLEAIENVMKVRRMPGVVAWAGEEPAKSAAEAYNVQMLPTMYLLDREGVIRARDPEVDKIEPLIRSLLKPADEPASEDVKKPADDREPPKQP